MRGTATHTPVLAAKAPSGRSIQPASEAVTLAVQSVRRHPVSGKGRDQKG
jgi:hypothetical protein